MDERRLEGLFGRFRERGDTAALGEVFDATAGDLLRLARRLTNSRSEAEDVVQATFLAAIERASSFDMGRALRPWLIGILVRQAGLARRRAGRARELDANAADSGPGPGEALAGRELADALAGAMEQLTPAEREVLVPLLLDGKRAVDIARELEKRPDTVHMRIHRGLARLRKLLPAGLGLGLAPILERRALARMKKEVIQMSTRSFPASPVASTATLGAPTLLGGTWLASKSALAVLLVVAGAAFVATVRPWQGSRSRAALPSVASSAAPSSAIGRSEAPTEASTGARAPLDARPTVGAVVGARSPSAWVVKGRILGLQSAEALPASLRIEPRGANGLAGEPLSLPLPLDSEFEVDITSLFSGANVPPHELRVALDHPRYVVSKVRILTESGQLVPASNGTSRIEFTRDIDLKLAAIVRGRVFAPAGSSASACSVAIHGMNGDVPSAAAEDRGECGSGGEYRLRVATSGEYRVVAWNQESAPATAAVTTVVGAERVLAPLTLDLGLAISGSVTASGVGQSGVRVRARKPSPQSSPAAGAIEMTVFTAQTSTGAASEPFSFTVQGYVRSSATAISDAQGRFVLTGLGATEYRVATRGSAQPVDLDLSEPSASAELAITAPATDVALAATFSVLEFHIAGVAPEAGTIQITASGMGRPIATMTGSRYPYSNVKRLGAAAGESFRVEFRIEGYQPLEAVYTFPGPGEQRGEYLQFVPFPPARLVVRLTELAGAPIAQAAFGFFSNQSSNGQQLPKFEFARELQGVDGEFVLDSIRCGDYRVRVHTGGSFFDYSGYHREAEFDVSLPPGADEARALTLALGGRIRVNLVTSSPEADSALAQLLDASGARRQVIFRGSEGNTRSESADLLLRGVNDVFPNLEPGEYRVQVERHSQPPLLVPVTVVAGLTSDVTINLAE